MKVSKNNYNLKTLYISLDRLKWKNVMKKRFWKKNKLHRSCVSRICRQLLNIELQKRKNSSKKPPFYSQSVNNRGEMRKSKNIEDNSKEKNISIKEPPKKKLKISDDNCYSDIEDHKENQPETDDISNNRNDNIKKINDEKSDINGIDSPKAKSNFSNSSDKKLLKFYTKNGVKVISTMSITLPKCKVSNILSHQKNTVQEQTLNNKSISSLSSDTHIMDNVGTKISDSIDDDSKAESKKYEIIKEELLSEDDEVDNVDQQEADSDSKSVDSSESNGNTVEQSKNDSDKEVDIVDDDRSNSDKEVVIDDDDDDDDRNDSDKEVVTEDDDDRNDSDKDLVIEDDDKNDSDEVTIEDHKNESQKTYANKDDENESPTECDSEDDINCNKKTIIDLVKSDSDKESVIDIGSEASKDEQDKNNSNLNSSLDSDSDSVSEKDVSFDPSKFLSCTFETDEKDTDVQSTNEKTSFMKSQYYQLNCDTMVVIKPLLPECIIYPFLVKHQINFTSAFNIRKQLCKMKFMGKYGCKNHYIHPPGGSSSALNIEDDQENRVYPIVDPFTHSLFAPIIKRDRLKNKTCNKNFRKALLKFANSSSQSNAQTSNAPTVKVGSNFYSNAYGTSRPISYVRPLVNYENSVHPYPSKDFRVVSDSRVNESRAPVLLNSSTLRIGENIFTRVYDNAKPTNLFRQVVIPENPANSQQHGIGKIVVSMANVPHPNNKFVNSNRFIYASSPTTGAPMLVPAVVSQLQSNNSSTVPVIRTISSNNSQSFPSAVENGITYNQTVPSMNCPTNFAIPNAGSSFSNIPTQNYNPVRAYPPLLRNNSPICYSAENLGQNYNNSGNTSFSVRYNASNNIASAPTSMSSNLRYSVPNNNVNAPTSMPIRYSVVNNNVSAPTSLPSNLRYSVPNNNVSAPTSLHSNLRYSVPNNNVSAPTSSINICNNNNNNDDDDVPPPLKFGVSRLINTNSPNSEFEIRSKPPQLHRMMTTTSAESQNSPKNNIANDTPVIGVSLNEASQVGSYSSASQPLWSDTTSQVVAPRINEYNNDQNNIVSNVIVNTVPVVNDSLSEKSQLESHSSASQSSYDDAAKQDEENIQSNVQCLREFRMEENCTCESNRLSVMHYFHTFMKYVRALQSQGFPKTFPSVSNAFYQFLKAHTCAYHSLIAINRPEILSSIKSLCNLTNEETTSQFVELPRPYIEKMFKGPLIFPDYDIFILKRFVFAVEKKTREILYPLPAACKFQGDDILDKITVVTLMSPKHGLGPGFIIFPHAILGRNLYSSLGNVENLSTTWSITAHQKGGLTQSMVTEFLNGEARSWITSKSSSRQTYFAIDWWLSLEQNLADEIYSTFTYISLQKVFPLGKDPFDIGISLNIERMWGSFVNSWTRRHKETLVEHHFPQFIYEVFEKFCDWQSLYHWCRGSGLFPYSVNLNRDFLSRVVNVE